MSTGEEFKGKIWKWDLQDSYSWADLCKTIKSETTGYMYVEG